MGVESLAFVPEFSLRDGEILAGRRDSGASRQAWASWSRTISTTGWADPAERGLRGSTEVRGPPGLVPPGTTSPGEPGLTRGGVVVGEPGLTLGAPGTGEPGLMLGSLGLAGPAPVRPARGAGPAGPPG
jgi:hypothetical protein